MASSQDIRLIATLAALKLTLLRVLVGFGTIVPLSLGICQHHDPIHPMECLGRLSLPKMHILLAAVSYALKRSSAGLRIYLARTRTARK